MEDPGAWRDSSTIGGASRGASGPRHYKPQVDESTSGSIHTARELSSSLGHSDPYFASAARRWRGLRVRLAARSYASEGGGPDD